MRKSASIPMVIAGLALAAIACAAVLTSPAKYDIKVPGGLAFADFKGYENWQTISMSFNNGRLALILGNSVMINAFRAGYPANGKPFPDGARMAKVHWIPKKNEAAPGQPLVPDVLHDVDFMVKDSKRFAGSGGWGYAAFEYDATSDKFTPGDEKNTPPQNHDAKCGAACHTIAQKQDYVFTNYAKR